MQLFVLQIKKASVVGGTFWCNPMQNVPCLSSFRSYESRHAPKWGYFSSLSFIFNVSIPINSSLPGRWDGFGEVVLPGLGRSSLVSLWLGGVPTQANPEPAYSSLVCRECGYRSAWIKVWSHSYLERVYLPLRLNSQPKQGQDKA